jgi:transcriptional regulator GlxA family with amidase domain
VKDSLDMTFQPKGPLGSDQAVTPLPSAGVREVVFLLLDGFTHLTFACAIEPLRLANLAAGRRLYRRRVLSIDGVAVIRSNGTRMLPDGPAEPVAWGSRLVVVGGALRRRPEPRVTGFVRNCHVHGAEVLGLCGGVAVLARAGLLDGEDCAVHWQVRDAFRERFPELRVCRDAFVAGRVSTAAGGTAAAGLMLHLIAREQGADLAAEVADLMVLGDVRGLNAPQASSQARFGIRNAHFDRAPRLMEKNLEVPLAMPDLARSLGLSVRQVERLFARHLGISPTRQYVAIRLERARRLLVQSDLSVTQVALACGFESPTHFGERFRRRFGLPAHRTWLMGG